MKRWKSIVLCAGVAALTFVPNVAAEEGAEPPRVLAEEPVTTASPLEAITRASGAVGTAAHFSPGVAGSEQTEEGASGAEEAPAVEPTGEALPSVEELLELGDAATVEDVEETVAEIDAAEEDAEAAASAAKLADSIPEWKEDDFKHTMQILRRFRRSIGDGIERVETFSEKLRNPARAGMLELSPYVADAGWAEVVELLYDDKCKEAKTKATSLAGAPTKDSELAMQYFFARIQMCAGEEKEGRAILTALSKGNGPIAVLAARRLGDDVIITDGGDDEEEEGMYLSQRLRQAKRLAAKDVDAALRDLDGLGDEMTRRWDKFKVGQTRAQILEGAGRFDEAGKVYLALYRKTRGWKVNGSIEDQLERLERKTGKKYLTYGERIDRMVHLVARGRYSDAKKVSIETAKLRKLAGSEVQGWMHFRLALQAERDKDREKAVALFEKADRQVKDSELRPRLYFGWARALRRLDRDMEAVKLYERLVAEFPDNHLCDEATYEAGRLLQFSNLHDRAIAKFDEVAKKYPDSDFLPDALWREALSHYLAGDYKKGIAPLVRIRKSFSEERDESELTLGLKATYWLGMMHLRDGDTANAEKFLQEAVDRGPLTWYGRLAAQRMEQNGWSPSIRLPDSKLTESELRDLATLRVPTSARLSVAAEFVRLGLYKDALSEMRDQVAIHPVPDGGHRLLAAIHLASGSPNWAHWIMKKHIDESGPTWATLRDWGTAFPLDYMELAHKHATNANVSPFLVQAIIRQESGFRPTVKSWAGAMGLMQLMPGTARWTTRVFMKERKGISVSALKDPDTNVELGSMYIRVHTAHAHESIPLALAGYNAGPAPLESWVERYGERELDAFVESITYQEARGYVRKVFTSYVTYSALYGGELPTVSFEVPEKLRKFGDVPELGRVKPGEPVSMLTP